MYKVATSSIGKTQNHEYEKLDKIVLSYIGKKKNSAHEICLIAQHNSKIMLPFLLMYSWENTGKPQKTDPHTGHFADGLCKGILMPSAP